ncbi:MULTISPECIES: hypothetical protein [unclassified Carboxydocella]|uniref:hypothetical protein n=1 Tax=unclassified Carboxydocella TaxID=2685367 RepID=UPI0009AE854A|nr:MULTISPECIES: hypothetical protein [unclassified Carboxydocella]GAW27446.1 hypothetical protein ULO1_00160 [Carboxydocella sp. ULO1]GAW30332.1 hypothetical protein JDF658_00970 [Carboxydocella sp. JDF658]
MREKFFRMLDANFNRCVEGLRVLEDMARFILEEKELAKALKQLRQEIGLARPEEIWRFRDVQGDPGTEVTTLREQERASWQALINANASRVAESLRVIEEGSKVLSDLELAAKAKRWRYQSYSLGQKLLLASKAKEEN